MLLMLMDIGSLYLRLASCTCNTFFVFMAVVAVIKSKKLFIAEVADLLQNFRIKTSFHGDYFELLQTSLNGSYHVVKTLTKGFTTITGSLRSIIKV